MNQDLEKSTDLLEDIQLTKDTAKTPIQAVWL